MKYFGMFYLCMGLLFLVSLAESTQHPFAAWSADATVDEHGSFVESDSEADIQAAQVLWNSIDDTQRSITITDFLAVPFDPTKDATDKLIFDSIYNDPGYQATREAAIQMRYHMDVQTYDRLHARHLTMIRDVAESMNIPVDIFASTYDTLMSQIHDTMADETKGASFAEMQTQVSALRTASYLFEGRATLNVAAYEDCIAFGIKDSIVNALKWLKQKISSNKCVICKTISKYIQNNACMTAGKYLCTSVIVGLATPVIGGVISKFICGLPVNFSKILAGWCMSALNSIRKEFRLTDTCICSFRAGIRIPSFTFMTMTIPGVSIGSNEQVCPTKPGECAWDKASDKAKWDGKSGSPDKAPTTFVGKLADAMVREGVDAGIGGIKSLAKAGLKATAKSMAKAGAKTVVKSAAKSLGKTVASSVAGATIRTVAGEAKDLGNKYVGKGAVMAGDAAARVYTRSATSSMNAKAKSLPASQREAYLRTEKARIAAKAAKIKSGTETVTNTVGKAAVGFAADYAREKATKAAKGNIAGWGTSRSATADRTSTARVTTTRAPAAAARAPTAVRAAPTSRLGRMGDFAMKQAANGVDKVNKVLTAGAKKLMDKQKTAGKIGLGVAAYAVGKDMKKSGNALVSDKVSSAVNTTRGWYNSAVRSLTRRAPTTSAARAQALARANSARAAAAARARTAVGRTRTRSSAPRASTSRSSTSTSSRTRASVASRTARTSATTHRTRTSSSSAARARAAATARARASPSRSHSSTSRTPSPSAARARAVAAARARASPSTASRTASARRTPAPSRSSRTSVASRARDTAARVRAAATAKARAAAARVRTAAARNRARTPTRNSTRQSPVAAPRKNTTRRASSVRHSYTRKYL